MNKSELVSFVRRSLLGREATGDDQKAYHFQRVAQGVGYAFDTLLAQIPLDASGKAKIESYYVKHYYNQPVKEDTNGYRYFGVSDDVVSVGEGRGIWYVQPSGGGSPIPFSHRPNIAMYRSMAVGEVMNKTFWRFGNLNVNKQIVIETIGDSSPNENIRKVDFGVIRAFSSYSDDEQVIVPDGRNELLIEFCKQWLSGQQPTPANDNV